MIFPYNEPIEVGEHRLNAQEILDYVGPHLTDERRAKLDRVALRRTFTIATVLDGLYDRGNVSAVMRSVEAMGYQSLHIVETQTKFKAANRVTQGTDKWLDIHRWTDSAECAQDLKRRGYQIVVTHLDAARPISEIDFTKPTAIVFGNERFGVSDAMLEVADASVIIPMDGFAQSFNISVAAAVSLYHIRLTREQALGDHADMTDDEKRILRAIYYLRSAQHPERLIDRALNPSDSDTPQSP